MARFKNNSQVFKAFAEGVSDADCGTGISVRNGVLFSYAEPIAVYLRGVTTSGMGHIALTTARFSVTTSKHRTGVVSGMIAACIAEGVPTSIINYAPGPLIEDTDHGQIRKLARERGLSVGPWGAKYDKVPA